VHCDPRKAGSTPAASIAFTPRSRYTVNKMSLSVEAGWIH
jgi:hypothetical protein